MFLLPLYWLLSPVLWILLPLIAIINPKVRHHWFHEKKTLKLAQEIIQQNRKSKTVVLFHAASTGEFEQLKPVLSRMDRAQYFILLSFFSPTVFTSEKNTLLADAVCYHPFDFPWSARSFFRRLNIKYYIITRNDIWPTHLFIAKLMGIHTVLINANLYRKYHYTSWLYRSFFKQVLGQFNLILTSSERLKNNLLNIISTDKIQVSGDSRLDRVLERKAEKSIPLLPISYKESRTLILGSIIPSDYPYIFCGLEKNYPNGQQSLEEKDHRIIIVPHEISQPILKEIETKLKQMTVMQDGRQWYAVLTCDIPDELYRLEPKTPELAIGLDPGAVSALTAAVIDQKTGELTYDKFDWRPLGEGSVWLMQIEEILNQLDVEGYCVIEGVIPANEVGAVRASMAATMQKEYEVAMEQAATVRAKGHRIGGAGVQALPGILNLDQSFAPYLTDARITGAVRA